MNSHFSDDTLRENLEHLANWATDGTRAAPLDREDAAEARFDVDSTVQRMAYLAHLTREPTN